MEIALRSALEQNGDPSAAGSDDSQDQEDPRKRSQQEDLLARTLENKIKTSTSSDNS